MKQPVLVLAPTGDDAAQVCAMLATAGIAAEPRRDMRDLCVTPADVVAAWIIADEAITHRDLPHAMRWLQAQPAWSALPIVLLSSHTTASKHQRDPNAVFGDRGAVVLVERPCRPVTLLSAVRIALRLRNHQREVRAQLARQEEQALELKRSNEALEQFSSAASHDLREPLRMITSYVTLLERRNQAAFDDRSREYVQHIVSGTERMRGLIEAVLNYAKVDRGRAKRERFASAEAVGEAVHNLELKIQQVGAQVFAESLPMIDADRVLIVQLFQNLIANAITYRRVDPRVTIRATTQNGSVVFVIEDNGIGIPPADRSRIFEAFQRLHTQSEHAGYGIGLATCARIVAAHGGRIWVESTVGVGSRFFVELSQPASLASAGAP